jgi:hypothetical protein
MLYNPEHMKTRDELGRACHGDGSPDLDQEGLFKNRESAKTTDLLLPGAGCDSSRDIQEQFDFK